MIYCGEDAKYDIEFQDEAGVLVNLEAYAELMVYVYTKSNDIKKYCKGIRVGFKRLTMISPTKYSLLLDSQTSKNMTAGSLSMELHFFKNQADFPDGYFDRIAVANIDTLTDNLIKVEVI